MIALEVDQLTGEWVIVDWQDFDWENYSTEPDND
jgi:hypothetical protein